MAKNPDDKLAKEAKRLGVTESKVKLAGFKGKDSPDKMERERKRQKRMADDRLEKRIAKAKAAAKMKPIDKRKALLIARLKNIRSHTRSNAYSDQNLKAWIEELELIDNHARAWNTATKNGTRPYAPGNKKKKTANDIIDAMDLDGMDIEDVETVGEADADETGADKQ